MIIKKKSLIVALISSFIISCVLVLTLIGYIVYLELKDKELKRSYQYLLQKVNAKLYTKYIEVSKLDATIEKSGPLKGSPIIEGALKNGGYKNITYILMKVKFLDRDGAVIYEVVFHPHEPSFGVGSLTPVAIPYLSSPPKIVLKPNDSLPFKKILSNCPRGITSELKKGADFTKDTNKWSGRFAFEVLALDF